MKEKNGDKTLRLLMLLGLIFIIVSLTVSVRAAVMVVALLGGLLILAGVIMLLVLGREFRKVTHDFAESLEGLKTAFTMDIHLDPYPGPPPRHTEALRGLAEELLARGFTWAGFYKLRNIDAYVLGMSQPELKIYALLTDSGDFRPPYAELSSFYQDGGSYCLSGSDSAAFQPRPENMVQIGLPGLRPAELLDRLLTDRPAAGLLDTPPNGLVLAVEGEVCRLKEFLIAQAENEDESAENDGGAGR